MSTISEKGRNLIFILGQPRSGTTLLQTLLSRHEDIFTYSESWLLLPLLFALKEGATIVPAYSGTLSAWGLKDVLEKTQQREETYFQGVRKLVQTLYESSLRKSGKKYYVDKTPAYYLILPELVTLFPAAKFIIQLRNPVAVLSSIASTWLHGRFSDALVCPFHLHNIFVCPKLLAGGMHKFERQSVVVKYEELSQEPEKQMRRVCEYLEISFDEKMLSYSKAVIGRLGDRTVANHSKPLETGTQWLEPLRDRANYLFTLSYIDYLGPELFASLGYDFEQTKNEILEFGQTQTSWKRWTYFFEAVRCALYRSLFAANLASRVEFETTLLRYYPKFPPMVPDFPLIEGMRAKFERSIFERLRPSKPIDVYWEELTRSSGLE